MIRGKIFQIEGRKIFAFGGASSHDVSDGILQGEDWKSNAKRLQKQGKYMFRVDGVSWWKEELSSEEEM